MSNKACKVYVIRHGETEWNVLGKIMGQSDSTLTEKGIFDAKQMAEEFKSVEFAAVYSSDLERARQTAEILVANRGLSIQTTSLLRERSLGKYEGVSKKVFKEEFSEKFQRMNLMPKEHWFKERIHESIESDEELVGRFFTLFKNVISQEVGKKILMVTHAGLMKAVLVYLGYSDYSKLESGSIMNLGYFILTKKGLDFSVEKVHNIINKETKHE